MRVDTRKEGAALQALTEEGSRAPGPDELRSKPSLYFLAATMMRVAVLAFV